MMMNKMNKILLSNRCRFCSLEKKIQKLRKVKDSHNIVGKKKKKTETKCKLDGLTI